MRLGEYQELVCVKKVDFGIYLSTSSASEERVLLPAKQIPDTEILLHPVSSGYISWDISLHRPYIQHSFFYP